MNSILTAVKKGCQYYFINYSNIFIDLVIFLHHPSNTVWMEGCLRPKNKPGWGWHVLYLRYFILLSELYSFW